MTNRVRTRQTDGESGTLWYFTRPPGTITPTPVILRETVVDNVLPGNGHAFGVTRYGIVSGGQILRTTGRAPGTGNQTETLNYPVPRLDQADYYLKAHEPVGGVPSVANAATELAAKTNPSRPHIDVTVFAKEVKEIPHLLFERSKDLGRDISRGRLSLEFGWKPLIGDLQRILSVGEAFDARVRELAHLERSGIRRKRRLFRGSSTPRTVHNGSIENRAGHSLHARVVNTTTVEMWGFCRWRINSGSLPRLLGIGDVSRESRALAALLGITPTVADLSTLWEILPFSWLADWCSNVGDYLSATRNIVGADVDKVQIMRRTYTESTADITYVAPGFYLVDGRSSITRYREELSRTPVSSLSIDTHFPFLNERKIAILGDIVSGAFRRSKIDSRKDAKTTWKFKESFKDSMTSGFPDPFIGPF